MPRRELPPEVSAQIDSIVEEFKQSLTGLFRFHGMETVDAVLELLDDADRLCPKTRSFKS